MELPILYEDADIVAVLKPSGIMTHGDGREGSAATIADWFADKYPEAKDVGEPQKFANGTELMRPGIVHRLDTDTSGVLVLAKTPEAYTFLKTAFHEHEIKKTYLAFVYGVTSEKKGVITFPIGRSQKDFRLRSAQPKAGGTLRDAITKYETIGDIGTHALLKVMPETGRTHQIRVHMKAIHHPIVCDKLYAPNHPCDLGFSRLGLHAYALNLTLLNGAGIEIIAPVPADLGAALDRFPNTEALTRQQFEKRD
jgi:23S rRNA pseudouridine1911/1915/1917 synthase